MEAGAEQTVARMLAGADSTDLVMHYGGALRCIAA